MQFKPRSKPYQLIFYEFACLDFITSRKNCIYPCQTKVQFLGIRSMKHMWNGNYFGYHSIIQTPSTSQQNFWSFVSCISWSNGQNSSNVKFRVQLPNIGVPLFARYLAFYLTLNQLWAWFSLFWLNEDPIKSRGSNQDRTVNH